MPLKVVTIVGARPQFIKASAVSRAIRNRHFDSIEEVLVHTGQHFDDNMSEVFFEELDLARPNYNLGIHGGHHGAMTGRMLEGIEKVMLDERPDWALIYGDTNSTVAGALAAVKLHIPVAHVEAGLRSFNRRMPEEINRILADRVSTLLFCPTRTAVENLNAEGIIDGVHNVGDVMYDVALYYRDQARHKSAILQDLNLADRGFVLATCHRAENTDDPKRLREILRALSEIVRSLPVVLPLHPRTAKMIAVHGLTDHLAMLTVTSPLSFIDMVALEQAAVLILTDSGGVQKEAFFYGIPCVTMRDETEWVETVELGWNQVVGASEKAILAAFASAIHGQSQRPPTAVPYGQGDAASRIISLLGHSG